MRSSETDGGGELREGEWARSTWLIKREIWLVYWSVPKYDERILAKWEYGE